MNDDIIAQQRQHFDKLQTISKKPILIKMKKGATPEGEDSDEYRWVPYKERWNKVTAPIYTRTILANEICFDPDVKEWHVLKEELQKVYEYCKANSIPIQFAYSGGNGIHGHLFLNAFELNREDIKKAEKYDVDLPKIIRDTVMNLILKDAGANRQRLKIDSGKVTFDKGSKGSMIREYGTTRPDGGFKTYITAIPDTKEDARKLPLVFPDAIERWTPPGKYIDEINIAITDAIERAETSNEYSLENISLQGNEVEAFPCIKKLIKNGVEEGRYYGAVSITLLSRRCGIPWPTTEDHIKKFFIKCGLSADETKLRLNNVKTLESTEHNFSCRKVKEHFGEDICSFDKCVLCKKIDKLKEKAEDADETPHIIKDAANKKLDDGAALDFLMENYQKLHIGDTITGKTIFAAIGAQSCINANGIQPKLSAGSGKGKSHAVSSCLHCVPSEFILETSLSGKALFHSDDLKPGMLIFSDDTEPDDDLQEVIKRSSTNFQKTTNHRISIKDGSEWTTATKSIPPRIVWILTSVNDNGSLEYLNRQLNLSVDESPDQDKKVVDKLLEKAEVGEVEFPINDDVLICREIIRDIKKQLFSVTIPYAQRIVWNDEENRRNLSQFLDLIRAFAVFNYRKRAKTNETTIEATEEDFKVALSMYSKRANNQRYKLNDNELKVLEKMVKDKPYKTEELQNMIGKSYTSVRFIFHGRPGHENGGLLSKVPALHYKPETEFLSESDGIVGSGEYEKELFITRKTKQKHIYILTESFSLENLNSHGVIASLRST